MLTIKEAADMLHVHPNTLRNWCDQGLIKAYRIGPRGDRRLRIADVEHFLAVSQGQDLEGGTYENASQGIEEKFKAIFESAPDEIYHLDKSGCIVDSNIKGESVIGYTRNEIIGKRFGEFFFTISQEQLLTMAERFKQAKDIETGIGFIEMDIRHKNGGTVSIQASVSPLWKDDKTEGIVVISRDVTTQKREEEASEDKDQPYRILFNNTVDGLVVVDAQTIEILFANDTFARLSGYGSPADLIGKDALIFLYRPEDRELVDAVSAGELFQQNVGDTYEFRGLRKDGVKRWVEVIGVPIEYDGRPAGLVSVRDITERKSADK